MDENWRNTFGILLQSLGAGPGDVALVQTPFSTSIVMLHIKSNIMKSIVVQFFAPGACLRVTSGKKSFWVLFFYCHPTPLRRFFFS